MKRIGSADALFCVPSMLDSLEVKVLSTTGWR